MRRPPAEPSSFMAGTPPVMHDAEWSGGGSGGLWRGEQGHGWEVDSVAVQSRQRTTGGDDSLLPTVDADLRVSEAMAAS